MNTITASRLNILKNCVAMRTLPWLESESDAGNRGTRVHEGIVKRIQGEPTMLDFAEEQQVSSAVAWLHAQGYQNIQHEVAYSLSPEGTVRRILTAGHRDYGPLLEGEVPGTLDVVADQKVVIDWKTGNEVDTPAHNWQMLFGGAALARLYNLDEVELIVAYVRSDHVWADRAKVSRLTLDAFWEQLKLKMRETGDPSPGAHCRYCPAAHGCPSQKATLATVAPGPQWTTECLSELNDSMMVERLPGLKAAIEKIEDALKARAPIYLSNGKVWKQAVRTMSRFNRQKAEELLGERAAECIEKKEELYFRQVKA